MSLATKICEQKQIEQLIFFFALLCLPLRTYSVCCCASKPDNNQAGNNFMLATKISASFNCDELLSMFLLKQNKPRCLHPRNKQTAWTCLMTETKNQCHQSNEFRIANWFGPLCKTNWKMCWFKSTEPNMRWQMLNAQGSKTVIKNIWTWQKMKLCKTRTSHNWLCDCSAPLEKFIACGPSSSTFSLAAQSPITDSLCMQSILKTHTQLTNGVNLQCGSSQKASCTFHIQWMNGLTLLAMSLEVSTSNHDFMDLQECQILDALPVFVMSHDQILSQKVCSLCFAIDWHWQSRSVAEGGVVLGLQPPVQFFVWDGQCEVNNWVHWTLLLMMTMTQKATMGLPKLSFAATSAWLLRSQLSFLWIAEIS